MKHLFGRATLATLHFHRADIDCPADDARQAALVGGDAFGDERDGAGKRVKVAESRSGGDQ